MRRCLVELLACPECQGAIEIVEVSKESAIRILQGTLACTSCGKRYPIDQGVPRMIAQVADDVAEIGRRFSFQWLSRWNGRFEGERCYGFNDDIYIGWVKEQLECRRTPEPGEWLLDAGCGSGEKTQVLARQCPQQNVVGMDLGVESLLKATAKFADMTNLDYVQGNVLQPPFKARQFDAGMSLGVLHHTPNTRQAFASFRRLLKEETTLVIWIYPTYWEGPEWRMPYFGRDFITFGQGYRMPTSVLRVLAHSLIITFYPIVQFFFKKGYRRIGRDLPFFRVDTMTRKERYLAQVFFCFDTLLPRYQWRHKIKEVESWFVEEGLDPVKNAHSFYIGSNVPVKAKADTAAKKELAPVATIRTNSAAISADRSLRPSAQRNSMLIFRPSIQPSSRKRCANTENQGPAVSGEPASQRRHRPACALAPSQPCLSSRASSSPLSSSWAFSPAPSAQPAERQRTRDVVEPRAETGKKLAARAAQLRHSFLAGLLSFPGNLIA